MQTVSVQTVTLAEASSKALLVSYGVVIAQEKVVPDPAAAAAAAEELGMPVVVKLNGDRIAHKTERGLVRLGLRTAEAVHAAAHELLAAATADDGDVDLIVAQQVQGNRELIAGLVRDPQLGAAVMVGMGGIFAEAIADVTFRLVPLSRLDAHEMIEDLATQKVLGDFRGEPALDREKLADVLLALSRCAQEHPEVVSIDVNPLIVNDGKPIAVDALIEVER